MKKYIKSNDATYQNKRNPNKFIETRKYDDGHTVARQYMKWDTPEGEVKNYTGAKDAKRGRYFRTRKDTLDQMLEDYEEVETSEKIMSAIDFGTLNKYYRKARPSEYDGLITDPSDDPAEFEAEIDEWLSEDNATFEGWAIARAKYYEPLAYAGMELAIIGKHADGSYSLYWISGDRLYEIYEADVLNEIEYGR